MSIDVILWNPSSEKGSKRNYEFGKFDQNSDSKVLTHIQLSYETRHVVVLVVQRQEFPGELSLILDDETATILKTNELRD